MARGQGSAVWIIVVVLVAAVIGLNYMEHLNSPTEQELEQQQAQAQQAAQKKAAASGHAPLARPIPQSPIRRSGPPPKVQGPSTVAPADLVIGNGPKVVALGYTIDPQTAKDPTQLDQIATQLQIWAESKPGYTVKIVCLDLPKDQLSNPADDNIPLGLSINGKTVGGCSTNPGEGLFTPGLASTVMGALP
jgi:hypothetical protein